jgi:hypothetical protein
MFRSVWVPAAFIAALQVAGAAMAQQAPSGPPPSWPALIHCAQLPDDDQLACFRDAMKVAGYAPKPAEESATRHHRFGLSAPELNVFKKKQAGQGPAPAAASPPAEPAPPPPGVAPHAESENDVFVKLERVALMAPDNRLLLVTADGGIWEQIDSETIAPLPREGQSVEIKKNAFGGFMCIFDKHQGARCKRVH